MSAFLRLTGLRKVFPGGAVAVDGLDLDVAEGELVALLGPSGCGKTTTLRCIAGFEDADGGSIELAGGRIDALPPERRQATMVFQGYALFPHLSVFENVGYGLRVRGVGGEALRGRVDAALDLVGLGGLSARRPQQLSGGQQQRVALARALVLEPKLLLFDEPLSNLDAKLREQVRLEIRGLQQRLGITSVYVTHDQAEAMTIADRIAVMDGGKIVQLGAPREIYEAPRSRFVADFIGRANFVRGTVRGRVGDELRVEALGALWRATAGPAAVAYAEGQAVEVMIRPEDLRIEVAGSGVPATVLSASYLGGQAIYQLSHATETLLVVGVIERGGRLLKRGDSVGLRIAEGTVRVF